MAAHANAGAALAGQGDRSGEAGHALTIGNSSPRISRRRPERNGNHVGLHSLDDPDLDEPGPFRLDQPVNRFDVQRSVRRSIGRVSTSKHS